MCDQSISCPHSDDDLKRMWTMLKTKYQGKVVRGHKLVVRRCSRENTTIAGEFVVRPQDAPVVAVILYTSLATPPTAFRLFCTLCHELGHWRSWAEDQRSPEYEEAHRVHREDRPKANRNLSEMQKVLIYEEESRAWRHGHDLAAEVGFADKSSYVAEAHRALRFYQDELQPAESLSSFSLAQVSDSA